MTTLPPNRDQSRADESVVLDTRGLCDLAHRAWRGRGLRHWGPPPLHGQVSITRGYSLVSLCLVLFDCAHASEASFKRPMTHALRLTPATPSVAPVRLSDSIAARHRWKTPTLLRFRLFIWTPYLDIANSSVQPNEACVP